MGLVSILFIYHLLFCLFLRERRWISDLTDFRSEAWSTQMMHRLTEWVEILDFGFCFKKNKRIIVKKRGIMVDICTFSLCWNEWKRNNFKMWSQFFFFFFSNGFWMMSFLYVCWYCLVRNEVWKGFAVFTILYLGFGSEESYLLWISRALSKL